MKANPALTPITHAAPPKEQSRRGADIAESRAHAVTPQASTAIMALDDAQHVVHFNCGAERVFGFSAREVLGHPFEVLLARQSRPAYRRWLRTFQESTELAAAIGQNNTFSARRADGTDFRIEGWISKVEHAGTRTYIAVLRDVTERELRNARRDFLAELGAEIGSSLDPPTTLRAFSRAAVTYFADCCIVALNSDVDFPACVQLTYQDRSSGDTIQHMCSTESPQRIVELRHAMDSGLASLMPQYVAGQLIQGLLPIAQGNGLTCIAVPIMRGRDPIGGALLIARKPRRYTSIDLDVAQHAAQRLASALANAKLYAAANRTIKAHDETLGFVSHDLRNPLNVIMMAAELLLEQSNAPAEFRNHWLRAITHSAAQMNTLIGDLLTTARAEAGAAALHTRVAPVRQLVREAVAAHEHAAESKGIRLLVREPDSALEVVVDVDAIVRALSNLIGNAVKHTPAGGTITVSAAVDQRAVHFSVADTGRGIPADHIPHLFERFWQAPDAPRGGAGLGLAIVKGVVEAHDGHVWVESEYGSGSTFHFTLPAPLDALKPVPDEGYVLAGRMLMRRVLVSGCTAMPASPNNAGRSCRCR